MKNNFIPPMATLAAENSMFDGDINFFQDGEAHVPNEQDMPAVIPILPLRNTVLFPGLIIPITVARDKSIQLIREANDQKNRIIGVVTQRNQEEENPTTDDLFDVGTMAAILRMIRMPDGSVTIIIQGRYRFKVDEFVQTEPYFKARIHHFPDSQPDDDATAAMMLSLKQGAARIVELSPNIPSEAANTLNNIGNLSFLVHFIASNLNMDVSAKQNVLANADLLAKANTVLEFMNHELQVLQLSEEIQSKVRTDLDKQQRDFILRQQIKAIQDELGEVTQEGEIDALRQRAEKKKWPQEAQDAFRREMAKLQRISNMSPEYGTTLNYVEWLLELPWQHYTQDKVNLAKARKILDRDHFGLDKVKERILEYLAVLKLRNDKRAPILCLYGPPGVGKTSLGKSIAESLGRQFVRISLGGVRDEAEIRGHRRTYVGALPGRIIQGLKKAKTGNPVFILDEIDKVGNDFRGDPASALLEVLDPEQNNTFSDHYLELDYDLSPVMFIATANSLDTIHPALRDRLEIIDINGYTQQEKVQIAKQYLLPKERKEHGLKDSQLRVETSALEAIIDGYTRESGVRRLSQQLAAVCRGAAKRIVEDDLKTIKVTEKTVSDYLGAPRFEHETYQKQDRNGVAIGLAWTQVGGEILFIETLLTPGKGRLSLTGRLGEVMKESANVAWVYLKAHAHLLGLQPEVFDQWDVHIHIPAGATPKDGPSAGVTLLSAMASAFTRRPVCGNLAMTGEITLRGKVLPVGGIQEKVLAASRAQIHTIYLSKANRKDVEEIKAEYIQHLKFVYFDDQLELLHHALEADVLPNDNSLYAQQLAKPKDALAVPPITPTAPTTGLA